MPKVAEFVRKLTRRYEEGMYTRLEILSQIVEAAATCPVGELADALPADWLTEVKAETLFASFRSRRWSPYVWWRASVGWSRPGGLLQGKAQVVASRRLELASILRRDNEH
jgi:hypothetical protein